MLLAAVVVAGQPRYDYSRLSTETLDRGVVAIRQADGRVYVSWRTLPSDEVHQPFNVYRNGVKLELRYLEKQLLAGDRFAVYGDPDGFLGTALADRENGVLRIERTLIEPDFNR